MAVSGTARFVSGEMMAESGALGRGSADHADVIDADYIEVTPEPRRVRPANEAVATAGRPGMAMLERRADAAVRKSAVRGGPLFWLAGGLAALGAFWVSGGHTMMPVAELLSTSPKAADLQIGNVRSRGEMVEGIEALRVDGDIRNDGEISGKVPAIAVHVESPDGATTVYRLGTLRTPLAPGAKYSFSGRLDMPKDGVKTVSVAFDQ
jgi:hypothetical protein